MQHNTGAVAERQCNTVADCITSSGLINSLEAYADMMARILYAAASNKPVRVRLQRQGALSSTRDLLMQSMYHNQ